MGSYFLSLSQAKTKRPEEPIHIMLWRPFRLRNRNSLRIKEMRVLVDIVQVNRLRRPNIENDFISVAIKLDDYTFKMNKRWKNDKKLFCLQYHNC